MTQKKADPESRPRVLKHSTLQVDKAVWMRLREQAYVLGIPLNRLVHSYLCDGLATDEKITRYHSRRRAYRSMHKG